MSATKTTKKTKKFRKSASAPTTLADLIGAYARPLIYIAHDTNNPVDPAALDLDHFADLVAAAASFLQRCGQDSDADVLDSATTFLEGAREEEDAAARSVLLTRARSVLADVDSMAQELSWSIGDEYEV